MLAREGGGSVKLPNAAHATRRWVVDDVAHDFRLLDVWALPVEGGRDDFDRALEVILGSFDPDAAGLPARALFAARRVIGTVLRWDVPKPRPIPGARETTLAERLPEHLRGSAPAANLGDFTPLYRTADEYAAEISNGTVHGVLHIGWADVGEGRHRAQLGVYVKPRGRLGEAYLLAIAPFRHLVVYPALIRHVGRAWATAERERAGS